MDESIYESEVGLPTRSGTQNRPEKERFRIPKELADGIREKLGLGPDAPIHKPIKEILEKWMDETKLALSKDARLKWVNYLKGVKLPDEIATPTALERVIKLNLLRPEPYQAALNAIEGNDAVLTIENECPKFVQMDKKNVCGRKFPKMVTLPTEPDEVRKWCALCSWSESPHANRARARETLMKDQIFMKRITEDEEFNKWAREFHNYPDSRMTNVSTLLSSARIIPVNKTHKFECTILGGELQFTTSFEGIVCADPDEGEIISYECYDCLRLIITPREFDIPDGYFVCAQLLKDIEKRVGWKNIDKHCKRPMEAPGIEAAE